MWALLGSAAISSLSAMWHQLCGICWIPAPCWIPAGIFQAGLALALRLLRRIALEDCIFWRMGSASGRGFWGQPGAELGVRLLTRLSQALALGSSRGQAGSGC